MHRKIYLNIGIEGHIKAYNHNRFIETNSKQIQFDYHVFKIRIFELILFFRTQS